MQAQQQPYLKSCMLQHRWDRMGRVHISAAALQHAGMAVQLGSHSIGRHGRLLHAWAVSSSAAVTLTPS